MWTGMLWLLIELVVCAFSKLVGKAERENGWEVLGNPVTSLRQGDPKVSS